ncbi:hypothetical protein NHJ6243_009634, partial [Beauveria neobassiana]
MGDHAEPFSKLEAGFVAIELERRPISVNVEATNRFAYASDQFVQDIDLPCDTPVDLVPRAPINYINVHQDLWCN